MKKTFIAVLVLLIFALISYNSNIEKMFRPDRNENTNITENSEHKENNKSYLSESEYMTKDDIEKKHNYLKLFDHSVYHIQTITVKQININPIENTYMVFETESGIELYLNNYSHPEYMFYGKYSMYYDLYDFTGYNIGDKFIIYYTEEIYNNIDMEKIGLVTIVPEYQLVGSIAQGDEIGEKYVSENFSALNNYLSETGNPAFPCMSIEKAVADFITNENLEINEFYKESLDTGGYYYTNGISSIACIASFTTQNNFEEIHPTYAVYRFDGIPSPSNSEIAYKLYIY